MTDERENHDAEDRQNDSNMSSSSNGSRDLASEALAFFNYPNSKTRLRKVSTLSLPYSE